MKMEITMEKIDELRKREKVSYKKAKEHLEANNGDVLLALCALEDERRDRRAAQYKKVKDVIIETKGNLADHASILTETLQKQAGEYGDKARKQAGEYSERIKKQSGVMREQFTVKASEVLEKVKEIVKDGHVSKINIKNGDKVLVEIPMTVAAPMALLLPQLAALGVLVAVFKKCTIEVIRDDGTVVDADKSE